MVSHPAEQSAPQRPALGDARRTSPASDQPAGRIVDARTVGARHLCRRRQCRVPAAGQRADGHRRCVRHPQPVHEHAGHWRRRRRRRSPPLCARVPAARQHRCAPARPARGAAPAGGRRAAAAGRGHHPGAGRVPAARQRAHRAAGDRAAGAPAARVAGGGLAGLRRGHAAAEPGRPIGCAQVSRVRAGRRGGRSVAGHAAGRRPPAGRRSARRSQGPYVNKSVDRFDEIKHIFVIPSHLCRSPAPPTPAATFSCT